MKVDDLHMTYMRAQIAGNEGVMRQALAQLTGPHDLDPLPPLVFEAFVLAVRKWFGSSFTHGQVIRLVAAIRSYDPKLVDPVAAESEIRRALGDHAALFPDPDARAAVHFILLDFLVRDMQLDNEAVNRLLDKARDTANRILATPNAQFGPVQGNGEARA